MAVHPFKSKASKIFYNLFIFIFQSKHLFAFSFSFGASPFRQAAPVAQKLFRVLNTFAQQCLPLELTQKFFIFESNFFLQLNPQKEAPGTQERRHNAQKNGPRRTPGKKLTL